MTLTVREQIVQAVLAALNGPGKPESVPACERVSYTAASSGNVPRMMLYPVKETVERVNRGPLVKRELTVRVDCRAAALAAEHADALANDMVAWATKALAGSRLGGLAHDVAEIAVDWSFEPSEYLLVEVSLEFAITYQTQVSDQTQR
jgi:hypothetical protein